MLQPYTIEELRHRVALSKQQIANGEYMELDQFLDLLEAELDADYSQTTHLITNN